MNTQARRLAMATAILCLFGFGVGGPAEAGTILTTPAGLSPGESFRFVFVTDGLTTATSTNIDDYNSFVKRTYVNCKAVAQAPCVACRCPVIQGLCPMLQPVNGTAWQREFVSLGDFASGGFYVETSPLAGDCGDLSVSPCGWGEPASRTLSSWQYFHSKYNQCPQWR